MRFSCDAANSCQLIAARDENHGKERDKNRRVDLIEEGQASNRARFR